MDTAEPTESKGEYFDEVISWNVTYGSISIVQPGPESSRATVLS